MNEIIKLIEKSSTTKKKNRKPSKILPKVKVYLPPLIPKPIEREITVKIITTSCSLKLNYEVFFSQIKVFCTCCGLDKGNVLNQNTKQFKISYRLDLGWDKTANSLSLYLSLSRDSYTFWSLEVLKQDYNFVFNALLLKDWFSFKK